MSTAKEALEYIFSPEELKLLPAIAERYPYRDVALPQLELEPGLADMLHWLRELASGSGDPYESRKPAGWVCCPLQSVRNVLILS